MNPYLVTSLLFLFAALMTAFDVAAISFEFLQPFAGIRWVRVHLVTLGIMTEALFGLLPGLVAAKFKQPNPGTRYDIWLLLTSGILSLLVGVPLVNQAMIYTGGALVSLAVILLMHQLWQIKTRVPAQPGKASPGTRRFYLTGLAFFLVGIYVGTGLWFGWPSAVKMHVPIEVHIHANNWGLLSLVFAGLLIDYYPRFTGKALAEKRTVDAIYWLMSLGALGLVAGPWTGSKFIIVPGLIMHLAATLWLLWAAVSPLRGTPALRRPGILHLITSYFWLLAPVLVAPLILLEVPGFPGLGIEQRAPQALIYGWVLQFGFALLPFIFAEALGSAQEPELGGTWSSLVLVHLGGVALWASIFIVPAQGFLHAVAYTLWGLSALPVFMQIWKIIAAARPGLEPVSTP